jgi:membrane dipeptidase
MENSDQNFHDSSIVIDCLQVSNFNSTVFKNMQRGGLTAVNCTCSIVENFRETISHLVKWHHAFESYSDLILKVSDVSDIYKAKQTGKTGIILGFQNTSAIEEDLGLLSIFYDLGIRVIQLTYMEGNLVGQGCLERIDAGLTNFGFEVIEEMNRLGILIDLSHVGHCSAMEAIEASQKPVAFTHANPKALCDHPRNKPDDALKAVAANGGVVGATIFPPFLPTGNESTINDFIDVIDYLVNLIGIDHVAIGTDFTEGQPKEWFDKILTGKSGKGPALLLNHPLKNPKGIENASDFPIFTKALFKRGYSESDIRKIIGENMVELFKKVWKKPMPDKLMGLK